MLKRTCIVAAQIAALWGLSEAGKLVAARLPIAVPGNLVGMCLLLALLATGRVPLGLVSDGAGLLTRHLPLFFVPLAVGLMEMGGLLAADGVFFFVVLLASAAVGLAAAGLCAQAFAAASETDPAARPDVGGALHAPRAAQVEQP